MAGKQASMAAGELMVKPKDKEAATTGDPFGAPQGKKAPATAAVVTATEVGQASPSSMAAGNNGKHRLSNSSIRDIISQRPLVLPTTELMDSLAPLFLPEWLEKKKCRHEEELVLFKQMNGELMEFRQRVIDGVTEKGYFELDEEEVASMEAAHQSNVDYWASIDFSRFRFATPEEEILNADGYHYPDEDDDDDDDDDDELEYDIWSEEEEDVEGEENVGGLDVAFAQKISLESN